MEELQSIPGWTLLKERHPQWVIGKGAQGLDPQGVSRDEGRTTSRRLLRQYPKARSLKSSKPISSSRVGDRPGSRPRLGGAGRRRRRPYREVPLDLGAGRARCAVHRQQAAEGEGGAGRRGSADEHGTRPPNVRRYTLYPQVDRLRRWRALRRSATGRPTRGRQRVRSHPHQGRDGGGLWKASAGRADERLIKLWADKSGEVADWLVDMADEQGIDVMVGRFSHMFCKPGCSPFCLNRRRWGARKTTASSACST